MAIVIPVDKKQCQAEKPNGESFMTLGGGHKMVRCDSAPTVIVRENKSGYDGLRGEMTLCDHCHNVMIEQLGEEFTTAEEISNV